MYFTVIILLLFILFLTVILSFVHFRYVQLYIYELFIRNHFSVVSLDLFIVFFFFHI